MPPNPNVEHLFGKLTKVDRVHGNMTWTKRFTGCGGADSRYGAEGSEAEKVQER